MISVNHRLYLLQIVLLHPHFLGAQFQATSFPQVPCPVTYNASLYPSVVRMRAENLASTSLNKSGIFKKSSNYNGFPVYRKEFLYVDAGHSMHFPGESVSRGVLRQSGYNIFLDNDGHWTLMEDGFSLAYHSSDPWCTHLLETSGLWKYSSNTGLSMQIRVSFEEMETPVFPDFYQINFAPLHINGFYSKTTTFSSGAPIYRKPGLGNMQNYLFLYKGSWMVAKDPLSTSLTYRMFQQSQGSLSPAQSASSRALPAEAWFVVNNDGSLDQVTTITVTPVDQTFPPSYTLASTGPVRELNPGVLGYYELTDLIKNKVPVYSHTNNSYYLYQNDDGYWVVSSSLATPTNREQLSQDSRGSPLPRTDVAWMYYNNGWVEDTFLIARGEATPETRAAQLRLGLSIGFPVAAAIIVLLLIICICCCLKKRKVKKLEDPSQSATLKRMSKL